MINLTSQAIAFAAQLCSANQEIKAVSHLWPERLLLHPDVPVSIQHPTFQTICDPQCEDCTALSEIQVACRGCQTSTAVTSNKDSISIHGAASLGAAPLVLELVAVWPDGTETTVQSMRVDFVDRICDKSLFTDFDDLLLRADVGSDDVAFRTLGPFHNPADSCGLARFSVTGECLSLAHQDDNSVVISLETKSNGECQTPGIYQGCLKVQFDRFNESQRLINFQYALDCNPGLDLIGADTRNHDYTPGGPDLFVNLGTWHPKSDCGGVVHSNLRYPDQNANDWFKFDAISHQLHVFGQPQNSDAEHFEFIFEALIDGQVISSSHFRVNFKSQATELANQMDELPPPATGQPRDLQLWGWAFCKNPASLLNLFNTLAYAEQTTYWGDICNYSAVCGCDGEVQMMDTGNPPSDYGLYDQTMSHTATSGTSQYWKVTFPSATPVKTIGIMNRDNCCTTRITTYTVTVGTYAVPTMNPVCISAGTMTEGGWYSCLASMIGTTVGIYATDLLQIMEVMAYSQEAIQLNAGVTASFLGTNNSLYPVANVLQKIVIAFVGRAGQKCVLVTPPAGGLALVRIKFKCKVKIKGVVMVPGYQASASDWPSFQTNVAIYGQTDGGAQQSCGILANYYTNSYGEILCNILVNEIVLEQQNPARDLRFCGFAALSDCNCAESSFDPTSFTAPPYTDTFVSGTTLSTVAGGTAVTVTIALNIPDTVSSTCGNADGLTKCGSRTLQLTDLTANVAMTSSPYKKVSMTCTATTCTLTLDGTVNADAGSWQIEVKISLTGFPTVLRTAVIAVVVYPEGATLCAIPVGSQNLLNTATLAQQSAYNAGFNTDASKGCNGVSKSTATSELVSTAPDLLAVNFWFAQFPQKETINTLLLIGPEGADIANLAKTKVSLGSLADFQANPICLAEGAITDGAWYLCSGSGTYLSLWSTTNRVTFYEIMAYASFAIQWNSIQQTWTTVLADPIYPAANVLSKFVVENDQDALRQKCIVSLAGTQSSGSLSFMFKAQHTVKALVLVPARNAAWATNQQGVLISITDVTQTVSTCGTISDFNTYSEQVCGKSGVLVTLSRSAPNVQISLCSVGILSDCKCAMTSFEQALIYPFPNTEKILSKTSIDVKIADPITTVGINLMIPDTISSVCGIADGLSFCGDRVISFTDGATAQAITAWPYRDFSYADGNLVLDPKTAQTTVIKVTVSLASNPNVGRTETLTAIVNQAGGAQLIPDQQLFASVFITSSFKLPTTNLPSKFVVLSTHSFQTEVMGSLLNVLSMKKLDEGKTYTVKMCAVPNDPTQPTSYFNVVVKFAKPQPISQPTTSTPKKNAPAPAPAPKNTTNTTTKAPPKQNNNTVSDQTTKNQTSSSNQTTDISQMTCTTDANGNIDMCTSPFNSKYTCQPDETGEMVCGTDLKITKKATTDLPLNLPTMVISEINKYGVFYLTFSERMDFQSLVNLACDGFINGALSEKTEVKNARYQKLVNTTNSNCSVYEGKDKKGGGRSPNYAGSAPAAGEDSVNVTDFNRNKYLLNTAHLNITIQTGDQDDSKKQFEWFALNITETQIKIQVIFENPIQISTDARSPDKLSIQLLQGTLAAFKTKEKRQNIKQPLRTEPRLVPTQIKLDAATAAIAAATEAALGSVSTGTMVAQASLNVFLNYLMSKLYTMINALQMTMATCRLNIAVPANVYLTTQKVNDIASFNLLPSDQIFAYFFVWSSNKPNAGFQAMGTQSMRLTPYLGSIFIAMVVICALSLFYCVTYPCRNLDQVLKRVHKKMKANFFWTGIIRLLLEAFFDACTGIMLSLNDIRFETGSDIFDFALTCLLAIIVLSAPVNTYLLFRKYDTLLDQEEFQAKYGSLTEGYYTTGRSGTSNTVKIVVWYFVRRILTAVVLVQMADLTPWLMITANMYLALADAAVNWQYMACVSKSDGIVVTFNNFVVLVYTYFPYLYAGLIPEPEARYQAAWMQAGMLQLMIGVNLLFVGYATVISILEAVRRMLVERHNMKVLKKLGYNVVVVGMAPWQIIARFLRLDWLCFDEVPRINVQIAEQVGEVREWLSAQIDALNRYATAKLQEVLNQEPRLIAQRPPNDLEAPRQPAQQPPNNQVVPSQLLQQQQAPKGTQKPATKIAKKRKEIVGKPQKGSQLQMEQRPQKPQEASQLQMEQRPQKPQEANRSIIEDHPLDVSFADIEINSARLGQFEKDNSEQKPLEKQFAELRQVQETAVENELDEIQKRNEQSKKLIRDLEAQKDQTVQNFARLLRREAQKQRQGQK